MSIEDYVREHMRVMLENALWVRGVECWRHQEGPLPCMERSKGGRTWCVICGLDPLDMNINLQIPDTEKTEKEAYERELKARNLIAIPDGPFIAPPAVRSPDRRGGEPGKRQDPMGRGW